MEANPSLGILLHLIGGLAAASFYIPYRGVKNWQWETFWLVGGIFSWIVTPWAFVLLCAPQTLAVLAASPVRSLFWTWFFGVLWGIGGLTFGLTMRYLGIALGYAIALGLCAAFGTLMPPLVGGDLLDIATKSSGRITLLGVLVCVGGIALSGRAGVKKERELSSEQKRETVREFNFWNGVIVAIFSGVMSASMAYGIAAGKPIGQEAVAQGVPSLWKNTPVLVVILLGGFMTNFVWCMYLILKNGRFADFFGGSREGVKTPLRLNYLLCTAAGVLWYLQFFFYGMGTTRMGPYDFSSWTIHMASIIIFSTLWGIGLMEWRGVGRATKGWVTAGIFVLILSMIVIGWGNWLSVEPSAG